MNDDLIKTREIIENIFGDYFSRYGFSLDESIDWKNVYRNEYCSYNFAKEYSDIELYIQRQGDSYKYSIYSIHRYLKGTHLNTNNGPVYGTEDNMTKQLKIFKEYLEKDLPNLPKGDFSWAGKVVEGESFERKIYGKLFSLSNTHPIYIKWHENDPTWEIDILKLLDTEKR